MARMGAMGRASTGEQIVNNAASAVLFILGLFVLAAAGGGACWGCPRYRVYDSEMSGRAELAQAESNRKIAILEAQAKQESAKSLAQAEIERAHGVAEANKIIGQSLHDNESYLRYLWIQGLKEGQNKEVVYVPTEANLPILEAGRLTPKEKPSNAR